MNREQVALLFARIDFAIRRDEQLTPQERAVAVGATITATIAWKALCIAIRYAEDVNDSTRAKGLESATMRHLHKVARAYLPEANWRLYNRIEHFLLQYSHSKADIQELGLAVGYDLACPRLGYYPTLPYDFGYGSDTLDDR